MARTCVLILFALLAAPGCSLVRSADDEFRASDAPPEVASPREIADRRITARDIERHVRFLAADARGGRGTPGVGLSRAAAWISAALQRSGLEPGGRSGYLQYWPHPEVTDSAGAPVRVPNVIARLPGSDLTRADEYVVVLAHYDGLGIGEPDESGDSIYNAADDNASGVAALLEVARAFAALPEPPARPVLFLAVSGTEQGRLGSRWFAEHPTVMLGGVVGLLELDTVGRRGADSIAVFGADRAGLAALLEGLAREHPGLGLRVVPGRSRAGRVAAPPHGDHAVLAAAGVPAIAITAGAGEAYHTPADEVDLVGYEEVARVARLVFLGAHRLAMDEPRPTR